MGVEVRRRPLSLYLPRKDKSDGCIELKKKKNKQINHILLVKLRMIKMLIQ